jgi:hypothetical protein
VSDALTIEFSEGKITKTVVFNGGKDGIHISGSSIEAEDLLINKVAGRAINAEKASYANFTGLEINDAETAVESCDLSKVTIKNIRIAECSNMFVVYRKKPEFGPAQLHVASSQPVDLKGQYILEKESVLILNGREINANKERVSGTVGKNQRL